jgi:hypothetical protein
MVSSVTFHWRPSYLMLETSGFASPPHDEFAFFSVGVGLRFRSTIGTTGAALKVHGRTFEGDRTPDVIPSPQGGSR